MTGRREIEVVADWAELGGARRMGLLTATPARGKEVEAVKQWRMLAPNHGLSRPAQDRMRRAFRVAEA